MQYFTISYGIGGHDNKLLCFDRALMNARFSNYNIVKVSSILPPGCKETHKLEMAAGSVLYMAYASLTSEKNECFASAVAVGIPDNNLNIGVIMEYSAFVDASLAKNTVIGMVEDAMQVRSISIKNIVSTSVDSFSYKLQKTQYVTTFAGVALWG
ncbi:pyruvoyl-dependent arginine decarboxylase [Spirochaetia bacterium]|nr:pyruvoyl-dependent arginine decarboxylase [Spirochaetia bacterium]